jgi:hypothetical protein
VNEPAESIREKYIIQLFLNCEYFMRFLALSFHLKKGVRYFRADWLALPCAELRILNEKKDRRMG